MRPDSGGRAWLRRRGPIDRTLAAALLALLAPFIAALAVSVWLVDGPPALIRLSRVGHDGRVFGMWKLRTMRPGGVGSAAAGDAITAGDDPRVTALGWRLRRWRLDELPQLLNVARGEMGLIGPRPEAPQFVDREDERWRPVLAARPGIVGPTQLAVERLEPVLLRSGRAGERYRAEVLPAKLAVDAWYVDAASARLDAAVVVSLLQRFVLRRERTVIDDELDRHPALGAWLAELHEGAAATGASLAGGSSGG